MPGRDSTNGYRTITHWLDKGGDLSFGAFVERQQPAI
jgi:hypothetical protein